MYGCNEFCPCLCTGRIFMSSINDLYDQSHKPGAYIIIILVKIIYYAAKGNKRE